jgi:hypothetical protein
MPKGGTLAVGADATDNSTTSAAENEIVTHAIAMVSTAMTAPDDSASDRKVSYIPTDIINNAGLSGLELHAATTFDIEEGVKVRLAPGGSFNASARRITVDGSIQAAGGSITLETQSNKSSFTRINDKDAGDSYIPLEENLTVSSTAVLDAAGEEIFNSSQQTAAYGYTAGGSITLRNSSTPSLGSQYVNPDHGYDLTVATGSLLSVQGGYQQIASGSSKGGDGGSLTISQQITEDAGDILPDQLRLTIDGELEGHALLGKNGGTLTIEAHAMTIFPAAGSPPAADPDDDPWDSIIFADNRFARTGFSSISLSTYDDLTVTSGSHLETSSVRRTEPFSVENALPIGLVQIFTASVNALPIEAGDTRISLEAGAIAGKDLTIEAGATISVAPEGDISLTAFDQVTLGGTLEAPAGTIEITGAQVAIQGSARILAQGVNLEEPEKVGPLAETNWRVLDGGTVSIDATFGALALEAGSLIDVSGSPLVVNTIEDGLGDFFRRSEAGSPGSVTLAFHDELTLDGALTAESHLSGLPGGALTLKRTHNTEALTVNAALVQSARQEGFDELCFASTTGIDFAESVALSADRRLILDAPQIISSGGAVTLDAPWVQIVNQQNSYTGNPLSAGNNAAQTLTARADYIDVSGNIRVNGFATTSLLAEEAIRLSDQYYSVPSKWNGKLAVSGNLTLQADIIYPTTGSVFTVDSPGLISILPGQDGPATTVFSAGGDLTLTGHDIHHAGAIAAPMGNITLAADVGRVMLAPGSLVSVSGTGEVLYGSIVNGEWKILDKDGTLASSMKDMTLPEPSITVSGKEVIITEGAQMDANGGGSLNAYEFLAGFDGTANPLLTDDRLVIVPDHSISLPELGEIYLEGYASMGLAEGVYSILPAEYAFLPGALILERGSSEALTGQKTVNLLHQPVIAGYEKAFGSSEQPAALTGYVLRTAADVLTEGNFDYRTETINNGGDISVKGDTLVMLGSVSAAGTENGKNGGLTLAGANINYAPVPEGLRALKSMADIIPAAFTGSAYFDNGLTSGNGALGRLTLGDFDPETNTGITKTVTFAPGQSLTGIPHVIIKAGDSITVNEDATIQALATSEDEGILELYTASLITKEGSLLHASNELGLHISSDWDFGGDWKVDDGRVHLDSFLFSIGSDSTKNPGTGLFMTQSMLGAFAGVKELWIKSETDIRFVDGITLATSGSLQLDSQRLLFEGTGSTPLNQNVSISADTLRLGNSQADSAAAAPAAVGGHSLQLSANNLTLGPGKVRVDGFTDVNVNSSGSLFFEGQGEFQAKLPDAGILTMTANGFFAATPQDVETLSANRFTVDSGDGEVLLQNNGAAAPTTSGTPGNIAIKGRSVTMDAALLDFPGGRVELTATGTGADDKVLLKNGTRLLARGGLLRNPLGLSNSEAAVTFQLTGGEALLSAANGQVVFENTGNGKNIIDVSATDGQSSGRVTIDGEASDLDLNALTLLGSGGVGGSLDLITRALPELGDLATTLIAGGFTNELNIQAREDDMNLAAGWALAARSITLAADGENDPSGSKGKITIGGTVSTSGATGGTIHIYAGQDLTLAAGGRIEAMGTNGNGGEVVLGSDVGFVRTEANATIDTRGSGTSGTQDGSVTFRADVTGSNATGYGVKLDDQGTTYGAKRLQAVKSYTDSPLDIDTWKSDAAAMVADLTTAGYTLVPEIEVNATGDLTLPSSLTLTGLETWRPGGLPGVLTFRAGGNLNVETSITDVPTALTGTFRDITPGGLIDSWSLNFIAGADLTAANPLATSVAADLNIGTIGTNTVVVYSESGDINLIAGQDILVKKAGITARNYMPGVTTYTAATFDGNILVRAGRHLDLTGGGVLQSAIGDIDIATSGDVLLEENGAIRTTGRIPTWEETDPTLYSYSTNVNTVEMLRSRRFWEYRDGGDIAMRVGGAVKGTVEAGADLDASAGWEAAYKDFLNVTTEGVSYYQWSANYGSISGFTISGVTNTATHGIATMAGGNITVTTGLDFLAQAGAFGRNNEAILSILSRGDLDGRFLAMQGPALLSTLGSFGTATVGALKKDIATGIGIADTALTIQALGNVEIGAIYNPTLANKFSKNARTGLQSGLSYTAGSTATINAMGGDALLSGTSNYANFSERYNVLPGTLTMAAARDIAFTSNNFILTPAPEGNLTLVAGRDIQGRYAGSTGQADFTSSILMSDAGMSIYDLRIDDVDTILGPLKTNHTAPALHQDDDTPVRIEAGRDIAKINLTLNKKAGIIAARDILNLTYFGQHMHAEDQSIIAAGRDFLQPEIIGIWKPDSFNAANFQGITLAGPGSLLIQAGNNLDLADSSGIQSIGSTANPALQDAGIPQDANGRVKGGDITVLVGYDTLPTAEETADFLAKLKAGAREVSALIAEDKESEAAILKARLREELFTPFLYDHLSGTGDLNMTTSGIQTISGNDAINIFAAGDVNVGVTTIESKDSTTIVGDKETGIFTAAGGPINLLAGGDVNVNESRVMTFLGGDIVVLSDEGDINAGRGSKAKVTAAEPQIVETKDNNGVTIAKTVIFTPPAVGSGLRTLAYDPDGSGPKVTPEPGDMYVVAWDGVVDAGEAGIEGGKLYLAATKVLNAQNISVGAGSVGMPAASGAVASLGALTGDSMSATESTTSDIAKSSAAGAGEKMAETAKKIADTISQLRFFVVKFLGFME